MSLEDLNLRPHPERRIAPVSTGSLSLAGHAPILIHRGGHKVLGRPAGRKHRGGVGYAYLHTAIDDHSRLAYTESLADERQETAARFWQRAHAWFTSCGITVQRVKTDNGSCYRSVLWRHTLAAAGITHKRTRAYRPQTNGKVERFNRTLLAEWAYARPYASDTERQAALPTWLHYYNHHRGHTALGGLPPAYRVPNLTDRTRADVPRRSTSSLCAPSHHPDRRDQPGALTVDWIVML
jgi:transposase InsO family protein